MVDEKRGQIIGVALRRFSRFGIAKTTMSEIADDLKLSKANLYYYFPDKFSLIQAIVCQIIEESDVTINHALETLADTLSLLIRMLEIKKEYFEKYHMLILNLQEMNISDENWVQLSEQMFQREVGTISKIFKKGMDRGELVTFDVTATSELYVAMIRGLAMFCDRAIPRTLIDKEEVNRILEKQKQAAAIFINGIKR